MNSTKFLSLAFVLILLCVSSSYESKLKTQTSKKETEYYSSDKEKYLSKPDIECTTENCPEPNFCGLKNTVCYCAKGLANYPFNGVKDVYFQY